MKVWVIQPNGYDEYGIEGIFDSVEAAKESMPEISWEEEETGVWNGGWDDKYDSYRIYEDEIQTLESIRAKREKERIEAEGERERMRLEARSPLPYEDGFYKRRI